MLNKKILTIVLGTFTSLAVVFGVCFCVVSQFNSLQTENQDEANDAQSLDSNNSAIPASPSVKASSSSFSVNNTFEPVIAGAPTDAEVAKYLNNCMEEEVYQRDSSAQTQQVYDPKDQVQADQAPDEPQNEVSKILAAFGFSKVAKTLLANNMFASSNGNDLYYVMTNDSEGLTTLHITNQAKAGYTGFDSATQVPWFEKRFDINYVDIETAISPKSTKAWFGCIDAEDTGMVKGSNIRSFTNLENIKLSGLDSAGDTSFMFTGCNLINNASFTVPEGWLANAKNTKAMFAFALFNSSVLNNSLKSTSSTSLSDASFMYSNNENMIAADLTNLNFKSGQNISYMFVNDKKLTSVLNLKGELSGMTLTGMFLGCSLLEYITAEPGTDWSGCASTSENMFYNCPKLVGGEGSKISDEIYDARIAKIDGGPDSPGLFSKNQVLITFTGDDGVSSFKDKDGITISSPVTLTYGADYKFTIEFKDHAQAVSVLDNNDEISPISGVYQINSVTTDHAIFVTSKWVYKVRFNANEKSCVVVPPEKYVTYGETYGELATVSAVTGYTFGGWYSDSACSDDKQVTSSTLVTTKSDHDLYAKWTAKTTSVALNANGGITTKGSVDATYDSVMPPLTSSDLPTRTGYTFDGYWDSSTGGTKYYNAGGSSAHIWDKNVDTATLYAHWSLTNYTISWDTAGGSSVSGSPTTNYDITTTSINLPNAPTKEGFDFAGWLASPTQAGGTIIGWPTNTFTTSPTLNGAYGNVTLTAQWTANEYVIEGQANNGTFPGGATVSLTYVYDGDAVNTSTLSTPTRDGYTFAGWFSKADNTGTEITAIDKTNLTTVGCDVDDPTVHGKVFAHWTPKTYNILYKDQGGSDFSGVHETGYPTEHTYGSATNLKTATKTGYTFGGWFTRADCTGSAINQLGATDYTANITLYAKWTAKTTSVALNANGGITTKGSVDATYDSVMPPLTSSDLPTRTGYTFEGYWDSSTGGTKYYDAGGSSAHIWDKNVDTATLYAHWSLINYTISWDTAGGSSVSGSPTTNYNITTTSINLPNAPTKEGFDFAGWFASPTQAGGTISGWPTNAFTTSPTFNGAYGNVTLTAQWTTKTYTITYYGNGATSGTAPAAQTKNHGTSITIQPCGTLERSGYEFTGWNTQADGTGTPYAVGATYSNNADLALFACWEKSSVGITITFDTNKIDVEDQNGNTITNGSPVEVEPGLDFKFKVSRTSPNTSRITSVMMDTSTELSEASDGFYCIQDVEENHNITISWEPAYLQAYITVPDEQIYPEGAGMYFWQAKLHLCFDNNVTEHSNNKNVYQIVPSAPKCFWVNQGGSTPNQIPINATESQDWPWNQEGTYGIYKRDNGIELEIDESLKYYPGFQSMAGMFSTFKHWDSDTWDVDLELDLTNLDTSNVTNMKSMFESSSIDSIVVSDLFDTSNVENMEAMFIETYIKNLNFSNFDTSNVTNMKYMFNQAYIESLDMSSLNASNVEDMGYMFAGAEIQNLNLQNLCTLEVTNMNGMFSQARIPNVDLSSFNTSNVTTMENLFEQSEVVSINLANFSFESFDERSYIPRIGQCNNLTNIVLGEGWINNTDEISNKMMYKFLYTNSNWRGNTIYNITLGTSYVGGIYNNDIFDFTGCCEFSIIEPTKFLKAFIYANQDTDDVVLRFAYDDLNKDDYLELYPTIDTSNDAFWCNTTDPDSSENQIKTSESSYGCWPWKDYYYAPSIVKVEFDSSMSSFYGFRTTVEMFDSIEYVTTYENSQYFKTDNVEYASSMFAYNSCLETLILNNFSNCYSFDNMFVDCYSLVSLDISQINSVKGENFNSMFCFCELLKNCDLKTLDVSNATDLTNIFNSVDVSTFSNLNHLNTSNVESFSNMFMWCPSQYLDLSWMDTSSGTDFSGMFSYCNNLASLDLSSFDMSNATNTAAMFSDCDILTTLDLRSFDVSKVSNYNLMFKNSNNLEKIYCNAGTNWYNSSTVSYADNDMFYGCSSLPNYDLTKLSLDMAKPSTDGGYFTVYGSDEMNNLALLTSAGPALAAKNLLGGNVQDKNAVDENGEILLPLFKITEDKQIVRYLPVLDPDAEYKDLKFYDKDQQLIEPKTYEYTQEQLADAYYYSGTDQFDVVRLAESDTDLDKDEFVFEQSPQDAQAKLEPKINGVAVQDIFDAWFLDSKTMHKDISSYAFIIKHINYPD